ncbi:MAG: hypothetical protein IJS37_02715 [Bacilli bacterium]|nr:hypothetical protein [Bacilli bacterium]
MKKISLISKLNYVRLFYRGTLFLGMLVYYILTRVYGKPFFNYSSPVTYIVLGFITLSFVGEMVERLLPSRTSSMGSQKQFKRNYYPSGSDKPELQAWWRTLVVVLSWVLLNGVFGLLYFLNVFDQGILVLISLAYAICDMVCILFFCPFQTWVMHNRCCGTCRIYNWDFAMICTPLVFIVVTKTDVGYQVNPFAAALVASSLVLLLRWEIVYRTHPERFSDTTNMSLRCINCKEKLCGHKKQLQKLLAKSREELLRRLKEAKAKIQKEEPKDE